MNRKVRKGELTRHITTGPLLYIREQLTRNHRSSSSTPDSKYASNSVGLEVIAKPSISQSRADCGLCIEDSPASIAVGFCFYIQETALSLRRSGYMPGHIHVFIKCSTRKTGRSHQFAPSSHASALASIGHTNKSPPAWWRVPKCYVEVLRVYPRFQERFVPCAGYRGS